MILTCPSCGSRFLLSAQSLAPEGRRVKCSSCREEWFQLPDPDELLENIERQIEDIPESVKPMREGSNLPVKTEGKRIAGVPNGIAFGSAAATGVFVAVLAVLVFGKTPILNVWPPAAAFYKMVGIPFSVPGEGLVFDRLKAVMDAGGTIHLEGHVLNLTGNDSAIPMIEASLRDNTDDEIESWHIDIPEDLVGGESSVPFKLSYKPTAPNGDHIKLSFMMRGAAKTASAGAGNNQAPQADDHAAPHGDEAHPQSHEDADAHAPMESSHHQAEPAPTDAPTDHGASHH